MLDMSGEFGQRAARRLAEEQIIWLVTTGRDGTPQPNPVWFLWDGAESLLIYSQPQAAKVRHIGERPLVALHFNSDAHGEDIVVLSGAAAVEEATPPEQAASYLEKYAAGIPAIKMTPESFAATFSAAIRVRITRVRGF